MRDEIDKIFPEIVKELGYNKKELNLDWLDALIDMLSNAGILFQVLFYTVVLGLLIFVIYKVFITFSKSNKKVITNSIEDDKSVAVVDILAKVLEFKNRKNYTMATLYLHYGTINFLKDNEIIKQGRDYTNREVLTHLKDSKYYETFCLIAVSAQGILFNDETITRDGFLSIESSYYKDFV